MSQGPTNFQIYVHEYGQTFTWSVLANVGIILAQFKYSRIAAIAHMVNGLCMFFLTYFFILWYMIPYGFIQSQELVFFDYLHAIIGCAMFGFIVLIVGSGLFTRFYRDSAFSRSVKKGVKNFHKIFAYTIVVIFKINVLYNWYTSPPLTTFACVMGWQVLCLLVWIYIKFFTEQLESTVIDMRTKLGLSQSVVEANTTSSIKELVKPYVIYNNYVYDASQLVKHHPGGDKVIQSILGREVDRFLYGMYSSELCPEVLPYSHSVRALSLLREPIMKIAVPPPYNNFQEQSLTVRVQFMNEVSAKSGIYVLGLVRKSSEFQSVGYSDVKQLGQYYSFTMGKSITRLYTAVNFLSRSNIQLINEILPDLKYDINDKVSWRLNESNLTQLMKFNDNKENLVEQKAIQFRNYLPIMIKVYPNGKFTSQIRKANFSKESFELSQPKGLGLELEVTKPGKIVIIAGGTGLFPFSDFIDLLFKTAVLQTNTDHNKEILDKNTILKQNPFKKFHFVLLAAINEPEDIHPITFQQLVYLSSHSEKIKTVLRVSKNEKELKKEAGKLQFTRDYFTTRVVNQTKTNDFSRVWICGPPKMATDTAEALLENGVGRERFLLL